MAENKKPMPASTEVPKDTMPTSAPRSGQNPAFRMMGLPRLKLKLPSRNWLIFLSITGSFTTALLYDRHHKKKTQQRWCNLVSHLAQEPLPVNVMPRRITIFLSAPPGDGLRVAREHFHEYIKPVLVAGALDWDVIEGRREGEVRAGLAEKIRKLRKRNGEKSQPESSVPNQGEDELLEQARQTRGIGEWDGVQGDLILGRHTWKEYIRGLHEGWLGPLDAPPRSEPPLDLSANSPSDQPSTPPESGSSSETASDPISSSTPSDAPFPQPQNATPETAETPESSSTAEPSPPPKPAFPPPLVSPASYPTSSLPPSTPSTLHPSLPLPLPHLLGFVNTPTRLYRFLTQRNLADATGAAVAALVLGSHSRDFTHSIATAPVDHDADVSPLIAGAETSLANINSERRAWEQELVLAKEEAEWHKSVWKDAEGDDTRERVWRDAMVVDDRIGERMRVFELARAEAERAVREPAEEARGAESTWWKACKEFVGVGGERDKHGWEMGLEGEEGG